MESIAGKWTGNFRYGEGYPRDMRGINHPFTMDLLLEGVNISGTCTDDLTKTHFDEPATIKGAYDNNFISFIKKYPGLLTVDENNKEVVLRDQPSFEIHYTGRLIKGWFSKNDEFKGEWSITSSFEVEDGPKQFFTSYGIWTMKRSK